MSNRPRRSRPHTKRPEEPSLRREVQRYADMLAATGMEDREVARAAFYAEEYGLDALSDEGCVTFDEPTCGNWDCVKPDHQVVRKH